MCLAIYKPEGEPIPMNAIKTAWESNPDGAGVAIKDPATPDKPIKIYKGFMKRKKFLKFLSGIDQSQEMAIHLRYATHGQVVQNLCHPFEIVPGQAAWVHNGILAGYDKGKLKPMESDTSKFTEEILSRLFSTRLDFGQHAGEKLLLERGIENSKGIILVSHYESIILNEHLGEWKNGSWFSNMYWDEQLYVPATKTRWQQWKPTYTYDQELLDGDDWAKRELEVYNQLTEPTPSTGVYRYVNGKRVNL